MYIYIYREIHTDIHIHIHIYIHIYIYICVHLYTFWDSPRGGAVSLHGQATHARLLARTYRARPVTCSCTLAWLSFDRWIGRV